MSRNLSYTNIPISLCAHNHKPIGNGIGLHTGKKIINKNKNEGPRGPNWILLNSRTFHANACEHARKGHKLRVMGNYLFACLLLAWRYRRGSPLWALCFCSRLCLFLFSLPPLALGIRFPTSFATWVSCLKFLIYLLVYESSGRARVVIGHD